MMPEESLNYVICGRVRPLAITQNDTVAIPYKLSLGNRIGLIISEAIRHVCDKGEHVCIFIIIFFFFFTNVIT